MSHFSRFFLTVLLTFIASLLTHFPLLSLCNRNCLPMDLEVRKEVTNVIKRNHVPDMMYGLMIALPTT